MTREERDNALKVLKNYDLNFHKINGMLFSAEEIANAFDMAIKALEQEPTIKNVLGVDCISRAYLYNRIKGVDHDEDYECDEFGGSKITYHTCDWDEVLREIEDAPSVTPQEPQTFEWCDTCKEYDQDNHCCHRWTKVIRNTVEEMKQGYERDVLDKIDEIITDALDKSTDQKESQTLRWVLDKISEVT